MYEPTTCFSNRNNLLQGQFRDILEQTPEDLHSKLPGSAFMKYFMAGMSEQWSNGASWVHGCKTNIFKENNINFDDPHAVRKINGWKSTNSTGTKGSYFTLALILYIDYENKEDKTKLFLNPALFCIFKALLYGLSSLQGWVVGSSGGRKALGVDWNLDKVTPGMIATCAIYACYLLTNDTHFQSTGNISGINYQNTFEDYLNIFSIGLNKPDRAIVNILVTWNQAFYPNITVTNIPMDYLQQQEMNNLFDTFTSDDDYSENAQAIPANVLIRHAQKKQKRLDDAVQAGSQGLPSNLIHGIQVNEFEDNAGGNGSEPEVDADSNVSGPHLNSDHLLNNNLSQCQPEDFEDNTYGNMVELALEINDNVPKSPTNLSNSQAQYDAHSNTASQQVSTISGILSPTQAKQSETCSNRIALEPESLSASGLTVAVLQDIHSNMPLTTANGCKCPRDINTATTVCSS
ncbi:hypothetical protein Clacol_000908 [Clathrus columnatus]|uniref:Uncharacterized protein n=1 Tax=Clathrus columnatus TaxID=1419009 RepID=A0AAV4ZZM2_9AGAM|nr:hypothetical protein Clacol_000908 [Clathrus columnatus]